MTGIRRALPPLLLAAAALICAVIIERSLACPVPAQPQPLRTLYQLNERIVVARVGAKEVLEIEEDVASVRVALHVTENVKGAPAQLIHLYHTELVKDEAEKDEEELTIYAYSGRPVPRLKQGERYLFFLNASEGDDGYVVNDESYGIKKLSDDDLKVYLERIRELADLTRRETEDKLAVVEWLVRCAEQPATRWEGAYELLLSAEAAAGVGEEVSKERGRDEVRAQGVAEESGASGGGEAQAAPDSVKDRQIEELPRFRYSSADPGLAPLLNAAQKQRLSDALVASSEASEGDDVLMQVVKDFGDPRLPGFLLARLHRFEDAAPMEAEFWLRTLAASLDNKQVAKLADAYTQEATYSEWEEEQTEAEPPAGSAAAAGAGTGGAEVADGEAAEEPLDPEVEEAHQAAAVARATVKRSAMLKAILARIDLFVSTGQPAEARP